MNNLIKIRILSLVAVVLATNLKAAEVPELDRLKEAYRGAVGRVVNPLTQMYLTELEKLRDVYTQAGNVVGADTVKAEIAVITQKIADAGKGTETLMEAMVVVPPNDPNGVTFGPVHRGDVITLSYLGGMWKNAGRLATENPDAIITEKGEQSRLVIAAPPENGVPGTVYQVVPPHTAAKPFSYTVPQSAAAVVLRINANSDDKSNPGFVTYRLTLSR
ncbi:hypothetical protein EI77_03256 [Prosthecobacter fusiformis]|uniref:DUF4469 domain-containing protein n=1 Tax=Prosthecobacter fusiformis TaxID=48464 RepID=A0A4R7RSM7_9BACT|nr:hypothetical protein [Prosthecobacter fusiformis]TDU68139.1 hypothetical protein EI77_03256 [Prosthecobacter fusiformis]